MKRGERLVGAMTVVMLAGCTSSARVQWVGQPDASASATATSSPTPSLTPTPTARPIVTPKPKPKATPKPTATLSKSAKPGTDTNGAPAPTSTPPSDGVPTSGSGTFSAASGGTDVVGTGTTLVTYRVEVEDGIDWGTNPSWTPDSFAAATDSILADPQGWTASGQSPITDAAQKMNVASWSFQRVSGSTYSVRIRLATPDTTDKLCGSVGLTTQGVYSCRYGKNIVINLRRWLKGAPGFPMDLTGYHTMVINHEMGHLLGFAHMLCPGAGGLAPVMEQETIDLGGCLPNAYPFAPDGTFVDGPWAAS